MKWRTDKPTADVIVVKLNAGFCNRDCCLYDILYRYDTPNIHYGFDSIEGDHTEIPYHVIEKWADLEEDETVTENNSLKKEVISYFQGYWPGIETAEQCNTDMHFTPLAIMRLAEHFAKWGAEHTIKELEPKIRLAYGKVSMNPFDCSEAFEELLEHLKK